MQYGSQFATKLVILLMGCLLQVIMRSCRFSESRAENLQRYRPSVDRRRCQCQIRFLSLALNNKPRRLKFVNCCGTIAVPMYRCKVVDFLRQIFTQWKTHFFRQRRKKCLQLAQYCRHHKKREVGRQPIPTIVHCVFLPLYIVLDQ